jgi:hypothetical protein
MANSSNPRPRYGWIFPVLIFFSKYYIICKDSLKTINPGKEKKTMKNITDTTQGGGGGKHLVFSSPR